MATKPTVATVAVGQKISASLWNAHVYNANNWAINKRPVCMANSSSSQTFATSGAFQAVTLEGEYIDTDSMHDTVTNNSRITINTTGYYRIWASIPWPTNSTGGRGGYLRRNGTTIVDGTYQMFSASSVTSGFFVTNHIIPVVTSLVATDYIELMGYQSSGGSLATFVSAGVRCMMAAEYVSDAG